MAKNQPPSATDCGRVACRVAVEGEITQKLVAIVMVTVCIAVGIGGWWFNSQPTEVGDNAASAQTEAVAITDEPQLQRESDVAELESLRRDFAPVESKTKKLWDIEPVENSFNDKPQASASLSQALSPAAQR